MLEYLDKENDLLFTIEYVVNKTAKLNDLSDMVLCEAVYDNRIPYTIALESDNRSMATSKALHYITANKGKYSRSALIGALTILFAACNTNKPLSNTIAFDKVSEIIPSSSSLPTLSDQTLSEVAAEICKNCENVQESAVAEPELDEYNIPLSSIGNQSSHWYTVAGKTLLSNLAKYYAQCNMTSSFEEVTLNIYIVPHNTIPNYCIDPITNTSYNTEYSCAVLPETTLNLVSAEIETRYKKFHDNNSQSSRNVVIPSFDSNVLKFNIYMSDKLNQSQRSELLVHEIKHCLPLYAFVQKVTYMYANRIKIVNKYVVMMENSGLQLASKK